MKYRRFEFPDTTGRAEYFDLPEDDRRSLQTSARQTILERFTGSNEERALQELLQRLH
ncbi:MAG: hypothetical protein ACI841_004753 [Planctomycetota bacterium]|jgi:hypothetical protein